MTVSTIRQNKLLANIVKLGSAEKREQLEMKHSQQIDEDIVKDSVKQMLTNTFNNYSSIL